ncbi:UDP-N-acetylmuramoyl-L-alanine--D-glutamate ligase [Bdellovibrio bacteriovorus]|uniref:UDP-N-acetylmuramoyl-L-alanine--D-glutamate ligase n=1 Tax=Bdellovibrio bacteriovorus TaxID=959 RepID=UPI0021D3513A|nr:UDP-N-acetylmuramoyl-L-alanine--D-glutamate ligase [Bdellovibrio bacteriovorus]UXR65690.1 UDP-N-acetylmuramoyl-L-alanine--D-glutamate ligase [Bdellovibrio bacteriovorus]
MKEFIKNLKTPIAIVGMGKSGEAARRLLLLAGYAPESVLTFDGKLESAHFRDPQALMTQAGPRTLVVSPGVPLASPWIQEAQRNGVTITSEISLACATLGNEKLIGVTGSVGKSTTVSILGAGLAAFSKTGFVGGNLGTPFADYAADVLENKRARADWVILELSSYQLENCEGLHLDYSAITYFTSNHLERYDSLEHYYQTKWKILSLTRSALLLNREGGDLVGYSNKNSSPQVQVISRKDASLVNLHLEQAELIGQHNQDNLALAGSLALQAGWPQSAIDGMKSFKGLAHRLESVGTYKGVRFINDSKATAMDSVLIAATAAHDTLQRAGKLWLLLGGRDKNLPWQDLKPLEGLQNTEFVFFGECRQIAQSKSTLPGKSYASLQEAMEDILAQVKPADTVLLSPGGTSLDAFKSFEDRGNVFKEIVQSFAR